MKKLTEWLNLAALVLSLVAFSISLHAWWSAREYLRELAQLERYRQAQRAALDSLAATADSVSFEPVFWRTESSTPDSVGWRTDSTARMRWHVSGR